MEDVKEEVKAVDVQVELSPSQMIDKYIGLIHQAAEYKKKEKDTKKLAEELGAIIMEQMREDGLKNMKDDKGQCVFLKNPEVYASFISEKKKEAIQFMKDKWGLTEVFEETIHPKTLSAILAKKMEDGEPVPDGMFSIYLKETLGHRS